MMKLVWENELPTWQNTTEEAEDAEFRATHDGKSAEELIAEKFNDWLQYA